MQPEPERYAEIQQALIDKGYGADSGSADGRWDAGWTEALKRFQGDQNLEASGKLTSLSLLALGLGPKRESSEAGKATPASTSTDPGTQPNTTNRESQ